jgi:hypothetical protein
MMSALDIDGWSASLPDHFTSRARDPRYLLDRRLGGLQSRSGRGGEEKEPHYYPCRELNSVQPVA